MFMCAYVLCQPGIHWHGLLNQAKWKDAIKLINAVTFGDIIAILLWHSCSIIFNHLYLKLNCRWVTKVGLITSSRLTRHPFYCLTKTSTWNNNFGPYNVCCHMAVASDAWYLGKIKSSMVIIIHNFCLGVHSLKQTWRKLFAIVLHWRLHLTKISSRRFVGFATSRHTKPELIQEHW